MVSAHLCGNSPPRDDNFKGLELELRLLVKRNAKMIKLKSLDRSIQAALRLQNRNTASGIMSCKYEVITKFNEI